MSHLSTTVDSNIHNTSIVDKYEEEEEAINHLPPHICANQRKKIEPEQGYLAIKEKKKPPRPKPFAGLIWVPEHKQMPPIPIHDHCLIWWPKNLCFRLKDVEHRITLRILNTSKRIIYIQYKGLWDKAIQSGASWFVQPKTRLVVAPGMVTQLHVKARPRHYSFIHSAVAGLQIATNFQRDLVVGYFIVPIAAVFESHISPHDLSLDFGECAEETRSETNSATRSEATDFS